MQVRNFRMHKISVSEIFSYDTVPRTKLKSYEELLNKNFGNDKRQITIDIAFNKLLKNMEVELVLRDSDDATVFAARPPTACDVSEMTAKEGNKGAVQVGDGLCHKCSLILLKTYDIILPFNREAHVETTPIPPASTLATEPQPIAKPSAGNESITLSTRKKVC